MSLCLPCGPYVCGKCWLYVVACRDQPYPVKVGISKDTVRRLAQHRKEKGVKLYVAHRIDFRCEFDAAKAERIALDILSPWRVNGDWFSCDARVAISAIERAAGSLPA